MKYRSLSSFIFFLFFSLSCYAGEADLHYTIARKGSTALIIKVAFTGNDSGASVLHLPNEWANQKMLYTAISDMKSLSPQTIITLSARPDVYNIRYKPGTEVVFSYQLHKDWIGRLRYPLYFRPVITPSFFYFDGYSGLVYPDLADTTNIHCTLAYEGFNKDDFIGNSFFANKKKWTVYCKPQQPAKQHLLRRRFPFKNDKNQRSSNCCSAYRQTCIYG